MFKLRQIGFLCFLLLQAHFVSSSKMKGAVLRISKQALNKAVAGQMKGRTSQNNLNAPLGGGLLGGLLGLGGTLGILENGGTLGTAQGITDLRIVDITPPQVSLNLLPGIGVQPNLHTKVEINGNRKNDGASVRQRRPGGEAAEYLLGFLDILVEVNITATPRLTQEKSGASRLAMEDCQAHLVGIKIRPLRGLPSGILDGLVSNLLCNVLPGLLCPEMTPVLELVDGLLNVNSLVPLGLGGSIQYTVSSLPRVTDQFIELDIDTIVSGPGGELTDFPPELSEQMALPPMKEASDFQLGLSSGFLGNVLTALQKEGLMDLEIRDGSTLGITPFTTKSLGKMIPKVAATYKEERPMVMKMTDLEDPFKTLFNKLHKVAMSILIQVLFIDEDLSQTSISDVRIDSQSAPQFAVAGDKLKMSLSPYSTHVSSVSLAVESFDVKPLEALVENVVTNAYLPSINTVLEEGIPLPRIEGLDFSNSEITVLNDFIILSS